MKRVQGWVARCAGLFTGNKREREIAAELESHLQLHIDDNVRAGMTPRAARRAALLKLGGMEGARQAYRDGGTIPVVESLWLDTRFAIRQMRKHPGFTATAVLMLATGMCASVTLFGFVDAALIKPLPYPDPNRLVFVTESSPNFPRSNLSYLDYLDWKRSNQVFQSLEIYNPTGYLLNSATGSTPLPAARVSDGFFRTLGVTPALGRDFYAGEDLPGAPQTVLLSYATWQKYFGGAADVLGKTVRLSGVPHTVIGVLPKSFQFAPRGNAELWTAFHAAGSCDLRRSCHNLNGIARLKPGVSAEAALAEMKRIARRLEQQYPGSNRSQGASVLPLAEVIVGDFRPILLVLLAGGVLLLGIACVNISSLLLARAESRRREIAVRGSLGASALRLMTQFLTESCVLIGAASAIGLLLANWLMTLFVKLIPTDMLSLMPSLEGLRLNWHGLAFALVVALLAALIFTSVPGLHLRLSGMRGGLTEGSRGSAGVGWRRLGANLVVLELAIAMVLLVGAGLLGRSLNRLLHVKLGFEPDRVATLGLAAPAPRYAKDGQVVLLARQTVARLQVLPGVQSVGLTTLLPVSYNGNTDWIRFAGRPYHGEHNEVNERDVSSDYLQTLHAKLLRGRYFTDAEDATKPRVAIINRALANKYYPGENAIGKRYGDDDLSPKSMREVVGIVEDIREGSLDSEIWPAEYLPFNQTPDSSFAIVLRTAQKEQSVLDGARAAIHAIDPEIGTIGERSMNAQINDSPTAYLHRSSAWLVGGFAAVALLLGVVGLYGVVAYSVSQRTREIGIRMALGAERSGIHELILKEAGRLAAGGVAAGLVCSLLAAALIRKLLFGVSSWDLPTLAAVAILLAAASLVASYFPARRAASVDPVEALRAE